MSVTGNDTQPVPRRGGRPTRRDAEECLKRILAIAQKHFLTQGYNGTSLEAIARDAGVAKKTLYHHFGSKAGLFRDIVESFRRTRLAELSRIVATPAPPDEVLKKVALHLLEVLTRPERVRLHKLILLEVSRFPKLVRAVMYDKSGVLTGMEPLRGWFRDAAASGKLRLGDPDLAADQFVNLVLGGIRDRIILGVAHRPDTGERERIASQSVEIFLNGSRTQKSA